jgi:hypothetical protein
LTKFVSLAVLCALLVCAAFAHAQKLDLAVSGSTLWSPKNTTASVGFLPPPLKGGTFVGGSAQYKWRQHLSFNVEGSVRYHQGVYNGFQPYRPILYDANAVYATQFAPKVRGDFMAGIGGETLLFYNASYGGSYTGSLNCPIPSGGCRTYIDRTHFLVHLGAGLRYYVWRNIFLRPEVHYYFVPNNYEFHSDNVFRLGASLGYTFGSKPRKTP